MCCWTHLYFYYPLLHGCCYSCCDILALLKKGTSGLSCPRALTSQAVASEVKNLFIHYISYKQDVEKL